MTPVGIKIHLFVMMFKDLQEAQLTFPCSKTTIETLGKGMKYVRS